MGVAETKGEVKLNAVYEITRDDVEMVAGEEGCPVLEVISTLQAGAAHLNDDEAVLERLTAIKAEILAEAGL
jgi:hypothetical protein